MRSAHYLSKNTGGERPSTLLFVDTETYGIPTPEGSVQRLWFGWGCGTHRRGVNTYDTPRWVRFTTIEEWWDWCISWTRPKAKTYVYSHNAGFDYTVLKMWTELVKRGWSLQSNTGRRKIVLDDPPTVITWYHPNGATLCLMDSLNYFRMPLKDLGASYGVQKLEMPEPSLVDQDRDLLEWDTYCKRDCQIILIAMQKYLDMLDEHDLGNYQITSPSQSFSAFRHRWMRDRSIFIDNNVDALRLSRAAYSGGRVECWRIGKINGSVYYFDVNSMYPFVMSFVPVPLKLVRVQRETDNDELATLLEKGFQVIANVELDTEYARYPLKQEGRLIFPVGCFHTVLATPELRTALGNNAVVSCSECAVYTGAPIFKEYVAFWYLMRLESKARGDKGTDAFAKLMLNALYGKFGQSGRRWEPDGMADDPDNITVTEVYDVETDTLSRVREYCGIREREVKDSEARNSHPGIAATITSAARVHLLTLIEQAGYDNVYYADTDSLMVNEKGANALTKNIHPTELGRLKLEGVASNVEIRNLKDYTFGDKRRQKGIRNNAVDNKDGSFEQDSFRGLKGMLQAGETDVLIRRVTKHITGIYTKGTVDQSGRVFPFRLKTS